MAHIAVLMTGLKGNLNASLELCSRFHNEGNKITYLAVRDVKMPKKKFFQNRLIY